MNPDVIATRAIYNFVNGNSYTRNLAVLFRIIAV